MPRRDRPALRNSAFAKAQQFMPFGDNEVKMVVVFDSVEEFGVEGITKSITSDVERIDDNEHGDGDAR